MQIVCQDQEAYALHDSFKRFYEMGWKGEKVWS